MLGVTVRIQNLARNGCPLPMLRRYRAPSHLPQQEEHPSRSGRICSEACSDGTKMFSDSRGFTFRRTNTCATNRRGKHLARQPLLMPSAYVLYGNILSTHVGEALKKESLTCGSNLDSSQGEPYSGISSGAYVTALVWFVRPVSVVF